MTVIDLDGLAVLFGLADSIITVRSLILSRSKIGFGW